MLRMNKLFKFLFICKINTLQLYMEFLDIGSESYSELKYVIESSFMEYHQAKSYKKLHFVTLIIECLCLVCFMGNSILYAQFHSLCAIPFPV